MALAFDFPRLPPAQYTAQIHAAIAPAVRGFLLTDPRFPRITPWLPWVTVNTTAGNTYLLGEDQIAGLLNDELDLPVTVVPESPHRSLFRLRLEGTAYQRLMIDAVVQSDTPDTAYGDRQGFLTTLRQAIDKLVARTTIVLTDLIYDPAVDFTDARYAALTGYAFLENFPIQHLRTGSKVTGWGLMYHTFSPLTTVDSRWTIDSALISIGHLWYAAVLRDCYIRWVSTPSPFCLLGTKFSGSASSRSQVERVVCLSTI